MADQNNEIQPGLVPPQPALPVEQAVGQLQAQMNAMQGFMQGVQAQLAAVAAVVQNVAAPHAPPAAAAPVAAQPIPFNLKLPTPNIEPLSDLDRAQHWLATFKGRMVNLFNRNPDTTQVIELAASFIKHKALAAWWEREGSAAGYTSWDAFAEAVLAFKPPRDVSAAARTALRELTQEKCKNLDDYVFKFQDLLRDIPNATEDEKLYSFTYGLRKQEMQQVLAANPKPINLTQAIQLAYTGERLAQQLSAVGKRSNGRAPYSVPRSTPAAAPAAASASTSSAASGAVDMDLGNLQAAKKKHNLTAEERERYMAQGLCFNCGEHGHRAGDCQRRRQAPKRSN